MTSNPPTSLDDLIARLAVRAADPERRVDHRRTMFDASIASMSLSDMFGQLSTLGADMARLLDTSRAGRVEPDLAAKAEDFARAMSTPVPSERPNPADPSLLDQAEADLGARLPVALRRIYGEVADGGFGPGEGLLGIETAVATYRELRTDSPGPRGLTWPEGMLPLVLVDPGYTCIELGSGRIVDWDPEDVSARQGDVGWARSFHELAPSIETWLAEWLDASTPAEKRAAMLAEAMSPASQIASARQARATIRAMSPQERAAMGLPEEDWEAVVWGGIGWDPINRREME